MPLTVISDSAESGRERYGAALVLVRPDQFVAWVGNTSDDAERVLRRVAGH